LPRTIHYLMIYIPTQYTLFPYTTLLRSIQNTCSRFGVLWHWDYPPSRALPHPGQGNSRIHPETRNTYIFQLRLPIEKTLWHKDRSEEHTSELQSREKLVCRLLLEKKKKS